MDALEAEAISAGLGTGDLGSRNDLRRQAAKEEQEKAEAEMRSNAYQSAIAKAEEASKALRQEQTLTVKSVEDDNLVFGDDYEDLQRSIGQARKLALKKLDETPVSGPEAVALVATTKKEQEDASLTEGEPQENKVIITEMEEFVLGLQFTEGCIICPILFSLWLSSSYLFDCVEDAELIGITKKRKKKELQFDGSVLCFVSYVWSMCLLINLSLCFNFLFVNNFAYCRYP